MTIIILVKTLQFILSLAIIATIHELGHFLGARFCKTRVEKFYLFFNPWFNIWKKKIKETEYGIGWIPLGGYVKLAGMVDESMDKAQLTKKPEPWEYRSKKPWQKLIIITGGVIFNFFLAWIIYAGVLVGYGDSYVSPSKLPYGIVADSAAASIGLRDGDYIVSLDNEKVERFKDIFIDIILFDVQTIQVERDGLPLTLPVPSDFGVRLIESRNRDFVQPRYMSSAVDSVTPLSLAAQLGIVKGDEVVSINGVEIVYAHELSRRLQSVMNEKIVLGIRRQGSMIYTDSFLLTGPMLGIIREFPTLEERGVVTHSYSFFSAIPAAFTKSISTLTFYWANLRLLISGKIDVSKNLGGFISIGKLFSDSWDWQRFWGLTAFLSLILGLMNILPIPALDGGHVIIILVEWIGGKPLSVRTQEIIQTIGFVLLVILLLYIQGLDIMRLFTSD